MKWALGAALVVIAGILASHGRTPRNSREVSRLRAYFESVDVELRRADISHPAPNQQPGARF